MKEKLIRDLIGQRFSDVYPTRIAKPDEVLPLLRHKLQEEVNEYLKSGDLEELADILEVIVTLARHHHLKKEDELQAVRWGKHAAHGGFSDWYVLKGDPIGGPPIGGPPPTPTPETLLGDVTKLIATLRTLPPSREHSLAITNAELTYMWLNPDARQRKSSTSDVDLNPIESCGAAGTTTESK